MTRLRRLIFVLGVVVVALLVGGCQSGPSQAYQDGYNVAKQMSKGEAFLSSGPTAQCSLFASRGLVPSQDDETQWEQGCQAALGSAQFVGQTTPQQAAKVSAMCQWLLSLPASQLNKMEQTEAGAIVVANDLSQCQQP